MSKTKQSAAIDGNPCPIPEGYIPVMVTTEHRGVFFGYVDPVDAESESRTIRVHRVRMCVYWTADVRGVLGLAAIGPDAKCRVTEPNAKARIADVTGVFSCSPQAVEAWEGAPWSR